MNKFDLDSVIYKLKTLPDHINYTTKIARVLIGFPIKCLLRLLLAFFMLIKFICDVTRNIIITGMIRIVAFILLLLFWPYHLVFMLFGLGQDFKYSFKPFLLIACSTSLIAYVCSGSFGTGSTIFKHLYTTLPDILYTIPTYKIPNNFIADLYAFACFGMENLRKVNTVLFYGMGNSYILSLIVIIALLKNCFKFSSFGLETTSAVYETRYNYRKFIDWFLVRETYLLKDTWY